MTLTRLLITQAVNNLWANHRLLRACASLDDVALSAPRVGFFPSILLTLNHSLTVDWYYVSAMERAAAGQPVDPDALRVFEPRAPFDRLLPLEAAQGAVDRRLLTLCRGLTDAFLDGEVAVMRGGGRVVLEPTVRLFQHLFQHQIHHRGQVHTMLSGAGVAPPQLDELYCAGDAERRAADLAALGLSEADIWGS
ncbi:DinB family protein [Myxococcota bacterium]|nr:DinB family protein [Myxococcota bacterium]